jgi:16S rRNA (cytosine1402-N4)-methyltransferase
LRQYFPENHQWGHEFNACLDGVLLDLGVSSVQLDRPERGFSFQHAARLDMRMNQQDPQTAYDIVNTASAEELADIFFQYGEERQSRRIAAKIVEARKHVPIETTIQLAELAAQAVPKRFHPKRIHPATRVFQALRIAVNHELHELADALERLARSLKSGGRICVISFHSLEDRIVKRTFRKLATGCLCPPDIPVCICGHTASLTLVSRKPIVATPDEQQRNSRSRSAKLRIAEKI